MRRVKILGIETSCDETACSIVEDGRKVLANTVASQIDIHSKTGGVVPEVAAREHVLKIIPVLEECLNAAGCVWDDIDALAVTRGPGLVSSLIIGTETASVISYVKEKPLIPVHHIIGHIYSNWLEVEDEIQFPLIVLTVSGGHNELILMRGHHDFEVLGETRDDAAGEAFDKVARLLGLGYPGGPAISILAEYGDDSAFDFPVVMLEKTSLDFSFSGLKTAVLTEVKKLGENFDEKFRADIAASFQRVVVEVLVRKLASACEKFPEIRELHLAGGVSANNRLREAAWAKFSSPATKVGTAVTVLRYPKSLAYCTDNAAMIASAAYFQYRIEPEKYRPKTNVIPVSFR